MFFDKIRLIFKEEQSVNIWTGRLHSRDAQKQTAGHMLTVGQPWCKGSCLIPDHASVVLCIKIIKRNLFWTQLELNWDFPWFSSLISVFFWSYWGVYFHVEIYDRVFFFFFLISIRCGHSWSIFSFYVFGTPLSLLNTEVRKCADVFNCPEDRKVYGRVYCTYHLWFSCLHSLLETVFAPISIQHVMLESGAQTQIRYMSSCVMPVIFVWF